MTRREAFEQAREDWAKEEESYKTTGRYGFATATCKWLSNIREARELTANLRDMLAKLDEAYDKDETTLAHYARKTDWTCNRFGMKTIDVEGAARLVSILRYAFNALNDFEEESLKD